MGECLHRTRGGSRRQHLDARRCASRPSGAPPPSHPARKGGIVSVLGAFGGFLDTGLTLRLGQQPGHRYIPMLLDRMAGEIPTAHLTTHWLALEDAVRGYELFTTKGDGCVPAVFHPTRKPPHAPFGRGQPAAGRHLMAAAPLWPAARRSGRPCRPRSEGRGPVRRPRPPAAPGSRRRRQAGQGGGEGAAVAGLEDQTLPVMVGQVGQVAGPPADHGEPGGHRLAVDRAVGVPVARQHEHVGRPVQLTHPLGARRARARRPGRPGRAGRGGAATRRP